ncbi:cytochrome D1 domain-containing protein [Ramlibacter sp.]|uniref:cytochrome D1 domain-containing protein n=1 Tax=Ramlibacter sp. TaxID=1917967 RepID=UPI0035B0061F
MRLRDTLAAGAAAWLLASGQAQTRPPDAAGLYATHCAACHGGDRIGGMGPALLPQSLERLRRAEAPSVIRAGRPASQLPGSGDRLDAAQVEALAAWIYTPVSPAPTWSERDIVASRTFDEAAAALPARPRWEADPMNLFVVVEAGDHHVSLLDGDRFTVLHRFASRFALHGGPKFSPEGRFVYFGSRDGWITKYDLWNLAVVAEVRAGLNMRNIAVSSDGRFVLAANYLPHTLALFDAELRLVRTYAAATLDGTRSSRVSAVYDAAPRRSFIVALKDIPELWEIAYDPAAEPIHDGLVHDFRMGEAIAKPGYLGVRRTPLEEPLDDFFFDPPYRHVLGTARTAGGTAAQVVNLDVRRRIASVPLAGMPHLGAGISFDWNGARVLATPNLRDGLVTVIDMQTWQRVGQVATPGPGFFMRSHENTPYAWVDAMMSPSARDAMLVIDKRTLQPVRTLRPAPGRTVAHVEFTRDGRHALVSLWEKDGALIVYDAATLAEVRRIPMNKPVGKYNVGNKLARSEGTSH